MKFLVSILMLCVSASVTATNLEKSDALQCALSIQGVASASMRSQPVSRVLAVDIKSDSTSGNLVTAITEVFDGLRGNGRVLCRGDVCFDLNAGRVVEVRLRPQHTGSPNTPYTSVDYKSFSAEAALVMHTRGYRFDSQPGTAVVRADYSGRGDDGDKYTVTVVDNGDRHRYEVEFHNRREFPILRIRALGVN